jgi:hypothetical protein
MPEANDGPPHARFQRTRKELSVNTLGFSTG